MIQREDLPLRHYIYDHFARTGHAPAIADVSQALYLSEDQVLEGIRRLHQGHALLLAGDGSIRMANPFSGVPTDFLVRSGEQQWWANCIWDGFGILVCTGKRGSIKTHCPHSGESLNIEYGKKVIAPEGAIVHFMLPFSEWYNDLVDT